MKMKKIFNNNQKKPSMEFKNHSQFIRVKHSNKAKSSWMK